MLTCDDTGAVNGAEDTKALPQRVYAEVNLDAIRQNIRNVMRRVGERVRVMAVIKADAYGHGSVPVAQALAETGCRDFGVATVREAAELRRSGVRGSILILNYVFPQNYDELLCLDAASTVFRYEDAKLLSDRAAFLGKTAKIHIKIDTGMGRIGLQPTGESLMEIQKTAKLPHLELKGIFSHFACADERDKAYSRLQLKRFTEFALRLERAGVFIPTKHICNSAGLIDFDDCFFDMVRCGIATYGLYPSEEVGKSGLKLFPALQLKSHVAFVKEVGAGFPVSYGSTFVSEKPMRIATVPVGYADGYPWALSNKGRALIRGKYAPVIGRVCMDQLMADVSDIPGVRQGDRVTLVGRDGENRISAEEVAEAAGTISYELCCGIGRRVPRVYIQNGKYLKTVDYLDKEQNGPTCRGDEGQNGI